MLADGWQIAPLSEDEARECYVAAFVRALRGEVTP